MRIFLGGGGNAQQSSEIDQCYASMSPHKRIAYLPQAAVPKLCTLAYAENWLRDRPALENFTIGSFMELTSATLKELSGYDSLFIGGGNTFELLWIFQQSNMFDLIKRWAALDRIVYGISAGAIILGEDILSAGIGPERDPNETNLKTFAGLKLLNGHNVITHYKTQYLDLIEEFVNKSDIPIIAIPEETGAFYDGFSLKNIGPIDLYVVSRKKLVPLRPGDALKLQTEPKHPH
jgi:dipeptidase E